MLKSNLNKYAQANADANTAKSRVIWSAFESICVMGRYGWEIPANFMSIKVFGAYSVSLQGKRRLHFYRMQKILYFNIT